MKFSAFRSMNFVWKYLSAFLVIAGILFSFQKEIFQQSFRGGDSCDWLPAGDYMLSVEYAAVPENSDFALTANSLVSPENEQGTDLIAERLPVGSGVIQFPVSFTQEARNIYISSEYVTGWSLQSVKLLNYDGYFLAMLCFLLAVVSLLYGAFCYHKEHNVILFLVGIGVLASFPLFGQSFPYSIDMSFHFARVNGIYEGMRTGQFPVRINPVQLGGFGYATGFMYPQLFLYFPAVLKFFHVSTLLGMQLLIFAANVATPIFAYEAVRHIFHNDRTAFMAAAIYTLNPYRLIDFYSRGAMAEGLAMVFLPLVLWGTYEILWNRKEKWWILALGMSGVLSSHLLSVELYALLIFAEMVIWIFSRNKNDVLKRFLAVGKAAAYTIILNLYFTGPFLVFSREKLRCFLVQWCPEELNTLDLVRAFEPFGKWEYLYTALGEPATMSVTLGSIVLVGICLFAAALLKDKNCGQGEMVKVGKRYLILGSLFFVASLWIVPWGKLMQIDWFHYTLGTIQFPWRLLSISAVLFSVVTALAVTLWEHSGQQAAYRYLWPVLLCALLLDCGGYFGNIAHSAKMTGKMEAESANLGDELYLYQVGLPYYYYTTDFNHISCDLVEHLSWLNAENVGPDVTCREPETVVWKNYQKSGLSISADVTADHDFTASMPLHYYPGYHISVDGEEVENYDLYSFLTCDLPQGTHHIEVRWETAPFFRGCDIASLCVAAGSVIWCIYRRKGMQI